MACIPMDADVLMIGVDPAFYDTYQRSIKSGLHGMHMGWSYVANPADSFDKAVEFIGKRPTLDVVYVTNEVKRSDTELTHGLTDLAAVLARHPAKPWVVLNCELYRFKPLFRAKRVNVSQNNIEIALCERHRQKQEKAEQELLTPTVTDEDLLRAAGRQPEA